MSYTLQKVSSEEWKKLNNQAHSILFGMENRNDIDTSHFTLVVFKDEEIGGYITCIEMDTETVYIQYGGVFPIFQKSMHVVIGYKMLIGYLRERYKNISTRIENTNIAMLKLAFSENFLVTGINNFKNKIYLELYQEGLC